ncbi:uncharacterized protein LOC115671321 isoform X2 [Syzygium oleosum]|uniref:uncharacterized protein LOC115671321 isoform X2 n=1 Tax=Syzygium oleosum TaxID=219896 RepID=UPI0024B99277|nr:uncharacterized protein LOC115671321 isoform X2 [Syzygium oleosum]
MTYYSHETRPNSRTDTRANIKFSLQAWKLKSQHHETETNPTSSRCLLDMKRGRSWNSFSKAKATSTTFLASLSTCSAPLVSRRRKSRASSLFARFFCKCARQENHHPVQVTTGYKETFSERMALAGLKAHHRVALGVSGGPDSMALCVLAADWKISGLESSGKESGLIDGLLAIIVDHGLRAESGEEANTVRERVSEMGIRCEIARCEWKDGRPEQGNLQEAAREMRYEMFHKVCIEQQFGILLLAHHADDQAELLVIRLSRNSGVLGLAGMAFTSQFFAKHTYAHGVDPMNSGILLVRPFLDFSKKDMYMICQENEQKWVEDPSNRSPLFVRNRIRMSLQKFSSSVFSSEVQSLISTCRRTRAYVDKICANLLHEAVTVMDQGYAVIDLKTLNPSKVEDICLAKFIAHVTQYISQRQRPIRGSTSKLLLSYMRRSPCKTSLTAAGCYLCPAPGSRGTKILVCCSVNCPLPSKVELFYSGSSAEEKCAIPYDLKEIMDNANTSSNLSSADASDVPFLNEEETNRFKSKPDVTLDYQPKHALESVGTSPNQCLRPGQMGFFMNRFFILWKPCKEDVCREFTQDGDLAVEGLDCKCRFCSLGHDMVAEIRHMMESDWLFLTELSKSQNAKKSDLDNAVSSSVTEQAAEKASSCLDYARESARTVLQLLKPVPVAVRRSLPVLVDSQGLLLSIPSLSFKHCPCLEIEAKFQPRVPLGGGHSSFI